MSKKALNIALNALANNAENAIKPYSYPIKPPVLPPAVVPKGDTAPVIAADSAQDYQYLQSVYCGQGFPGYAYLSQLATRAEFMRLAMSLSTELTRGGIEFTSKQDDESDNNHKIKAIDAEFKRLGVMSVMLQCAINECYFGRGQMHPEIDGAKLDKPLIISKNTIRIGSFKRLVSIEPIWTTPSKYNAIDPTAGDFYRPTEWYCMGNKLHASRLLTVITRPLPDILKPAYNFSGMSLSQMAEPYVDNWLRTRQSVSDLINQFSLTVLATTMSDILQSAEGNDPDAGSNLLARAKLLAAYRTNQGVLLLDKEAEEIQQINTPLSGLDALQAQAQEQMCSVSRIPAIVFTGISPGGLNANSDGELKVFYDWIKSQQDAYWRAPLTIVLKLVQLSLFGEVDEDIDFSFVPLQQSTPTEQADIRLKNMQTDQGYASLGAVSPQEIREKLAQDPDSGYQSLDTTLEIVPPNDDPFGDNTSKSDPLAQDGDFKESDHPRDKDGKFGSGSGSGKPKHSPEQISKWAKEKKDREHAQALARSDENDSNKKIRENAASNVTNAISAVNFTPDEISSIQNYYLSGDRHGANAEGRNAMVSAIQRDAERNGLTVKKVSESDNGKGKSLYVEYNGKLIRVSDHELPNTPERQSNRESGLTGKWDREVIVTDWMNTRMSDYINDIKNP